MTPGAADTTILVFARAPEPGVAKTRLIPLLGAEGAAALQRVMIERALNTALAAGAGAVELWCAPCAQHPLLAPYCRKTGIAAHTQCDGDLGARMRHAATAALARCARVLLIGVDCPALTASDLQRAIRALERDNDAVVVPAEDGGYVLLGLRRCEALLFEGIRWGSDTVMAATRGRFDQLGWRWLELPLSWDVDRAEDVERLLASGMIPDLEMTLGLQRKTRARRSPPRI
jgi:rSAM/selenodomain-associated transferase 1